MKDILIITSYYPPETGAASNRIFHLAQGLSEHNHKVSVLTPLPNYPTGKIFPAYSGKFRVTTTEHQVKVHRLWIYASNSKNKILRLIAMLSYSFSLIWFFLWNKCPKTVIVQSPPLLVAFTCMLFLKTKQRKLILNISDLWPIAGLELGAFKRNMSYRLLERIERFNYRRADLILGQSNEILSHVEQTVGKKSSMLYRNFPDLNRKKTPFQNSKGKLKLVYAGLLGVAQGIYNLCENLDYEHIEFHIYGRGAEESKIKAFIKDHPELPIHYYGEITREELHKTIVKYDLTIIPLLKRIYGSVPSKIFEYAKLGLPMLYFGGGEGEDIINVHRIGWVAEAGNYKALNKVLASLDKKDVEDSFRNHIHRVAQTEFNFNSQLMALKEQL